jgi:hypothetical protein
LVVSRKPDKIAAYEPPSVTDLGKLEDITGSGTSMGPKEGINAKT